MSQRPRAVPAAADRASAPADGEGGPGRRQRKKQHTRDALIEAAVELFAAKGYDRTAVREITDAVDVSERTFFRYFASKEDLVLSFIRDGLNAFAGALASRPRQEDPFTAARNAFHASIRQLTSGAGDAPPYLAVLRLVDSTPALLAAHMRYVHDHDDEVIRVLAGREGIDPVADRRPRVIAAIIGSLAFLAIRDWQAAGSDDIETVAEAFDGYAAQVIPALSGGWNAEG